MSEEKKIFDKKFVHFMWDDELEGKDGFFADDICELTNRVHSGDLHHTKMRRSLNPAFPFKDTNNNNWLFFYHDPLYDVKLAWKQGKTVQYMTTIYAKNRWEDVPNEWYWDGDADTEYRIKPEKEWRPCKDVQELKKVWYGKMPFDVLNDGPEEPFIWVRWKGGREHKLITGYYNGGSQVFLCGEWISLERLFKYYEFLDGSRCGVEEQI